MPELTKLKAEQPLKVICDVEANGLQPTEIHVVVCKDVDTGEVYAFRERDLFAEFASRIGVYIGHNFLSYDLGALKSVWDIDVDWHNVIDTLVLSRLTDATLNDFKRPHSLEAWGHRLGVKKVGAGISDWSVYTPEMEARCRSDVEINYRLYKKLLPIISSPVWAPSIETEHFIAHHCLTLHENGFAFDLKGAVALKETIDKELSEIDADLLSSFPPRTHLVKEYIPRATKYGTISRSSIPRGETDLTKFVIGEPFRIYEEVPFNPASPRQIVERLNESGWCPTERTKGHREALKALGDLRRPRKGKRYRQPDPVAVQALEDRLKEYEVYGWSVSEENLRTLPDTAPAAAHRLVRRLLLASRSSTLASWIKACDEKDSRIYGSFNGIGAWTHRMSHDRPNMGNVPKYDAKQPHKTPYSDKMRSLWISGRGRYLVGVDAESIQLRVFGHYINDKGFIDALVSGDKSKGTDPHALNVRALGAICRSRDDAKTFIYAWLLGAGLNKVAQILGCSFEEAREACENFLGFYPGLTHLKKNVIPLDALKGYFQGFDGRYVRIWGEDEGQRQHFTLAGYLQNGESVIMKRAVQIWYPKLVKEKVPFWWVNFVHDEWQVETVRDLEVAKYVATTMADAVRQVGVDLNLRCPMAGSILNAHGKLAVGDNWMETH